MVKRSLVRTRVAPSGVPKIGCVFHGDPSGNDLRIIYGVQPPLSPLSGGKGIPPDLEEHQSPPVKGFTLRGSP